MCIAHIEDTGVVVIFLWIIERHITYLCNTNAAGERTESRRACQMGLVRLY